MGKKTYIIKDQGKGTISNIPVNRIIEVGGDSTINEGIQSIVPGTNIAVDNTDPLNPVVSSVGGGGLSRFGIEDNINNSGNRSFVSNNNTEFNELYQTALGSSYGYFHKMYNDITLAIGKQNGSTAFVNLFPGRVQLYANYDGSFCRIAAEDDGYIVLDSNKGMKVNNNPGTAGQVITSQGSGLPAIWADAGGGATPDLQTVLTAGNTALGPIIIDDGASNTATLSNLTLQIANASSVIAGLEFNKLAFIDLGNSSVKGIDANHLAGDSISLLLPNGNLGPLTLPVSVNGVFASSAGDITVPSSTLQGILDFDHSLINNINRQGTDAGSGSTGANSNLFGSEAGFNSSANNLNAFGDRAAYNNQNGNVNAIGSLSAYNNIGSDINALGQYACSGNNASNVNALGYQSSLNNTHNFVNTFGFNAIADGPNQTVLSGQNFQTIFDYNTLTADNKLIIPDSSGTIALTSYVDAQKPYKVYVATLFQSGTSAPVATVLENTLGGVVTWSRVSTGHYRATFTNITSDFTKLVSFIGPTYFSYVKVAANHSGSQPNGYDIVVTDTATGNPIESVLGNISIEIRIYP